MLVVPIEKDVIVTKDGLVYRVVEYTNYKDGGPAVYVRSKTDKTLVLVYFFDIAKINKVSVEYKRGSKVFQALGKIVRAEHIPQPDDKISVGKEEAVIDVKDLKLKSKTYGSNKGLLVKTSDDKYYRLKQITGIDRALGDDSFDRETFLSLYHDYLGV